MEHVTGKEPTQLSCDIQGLALDGAEEKMAIQYTGSRVYRGQINESTFTRENPVGCRQRRPIPPDGGARVRRTRTVSCTLHQSSTVVPRRIEMLQESETPLPWVTTLRTS
jgi:hypothetical protein